jgi:hypothetical protein
MHHATPDNRAIATAPKQKAKTAAQKRRAVPAVPSEKKGQRSHACRPPAISPCGAAAYGFLKIRFLPHYTGQATAGGIEKEGFYRSFALLCSHYNICPAATHNLAYPYGSRLALHEAARLLKEKYPQHIEVELHEGNGNFALNVTESYYTGNVLFYIPVEPLHLLMRDKKRKKAAQLLLCVFSYLYRVAGVPYHTDDSSYLCWNYEMIAEWVTNDPDGWEEENYHSYVSELRRALHIGDTMLRRLWNTIHLDRFGEWVTAFSPNDAFGTDSLRLAQKFFALWQEFPEAHIYSHADMDCLPDPDEGYDDNDCITMEKHIGFVAATSGWLYDSLEQAVNSEFGECLSKQEPVLKRCFDGREQQTDSLDYECRLFPMINELCHLLNHYDYDT